MKELAKKFFNEIITTNATDLSDDSFSSDGNSEADVKESFMFQIDQSKTR